MSDFINKNKGLLITGGLAAIGLICSGIYYIAKDFDFTSKSTNDDYKNYKLSKWLENYIEFIQKQLSDSKNELTVKVVAYMANFGRELEEYLMERDFADLENERLNNLDNVIKYNELIQKTLIARQELNKQADKFIEETFGFKMETIEAAIHKADTKLGANWNKIWHSCNFPYNKDDLPVVKTEVLKEAYLEYSKEMKDNFQKIKDEMDLAERIPHYNDIAQEKIFKIKYMTQDRSKKKYGFNEKYQEALILNNEELKYDQDIINVQKGLPVKEKENFMVEPKDNGMVISKGK